MSPMQPLVDYAYPADRQSWNGLVLVGEAPGRDEVKMGMPFVGRSGQLLNEMLRESGIDRSRSLIANTFRLQPEGNKIALFFSSKRAAEAQNISLNTDLGRYGSAWCKDEYSSEINTLRDTLKAWRPRLVIALGRTPFWALTGHPGNLLSVVGNLLECRLHNETKVLPTFHPSYILRGNWAKKPEWLEHFHFAAHYVAQK